ncbi:hypothetical protein TrVE_jg8099 [Triparma verrucosa]|uniref:Uncharacterized protein n=1 Tax=Triparma verrucosa TaxID=1606542 RepID=A0A9W7BG65_9STRA|nr:hypothetical protein TrVE_jg8099 [Triparma verrucosa]
MRYYTDSDSDADADADSFDDFFEGDIAEVSDEVTLLAAHSYLKRKRRLPWTAKEDRERKKKSTTVSGRETGYFWDPSDLPSDSRSESSSSLLSSSSPPPSSSLLSADFVEDTPVDVSRIEQPKSVQIFRDSFADQLLELLGDEEAEDDDDENNDDVEGSDDKSKAGGGDDDDEEAQQESTNYFGNPDPYVAAKPRKQSVAKKAMFSDAEFKKYWYDKRWGKDYTSKRKIKAIQNRVKDLPREVLQSKELSSLTDEEVTSAVQTYLSSSSKKASQTSLRHLNGYSTHSASRLTEATSHSSTFKLSSTPPSLSTRRSTFSARSKLGHVTRSLSPSTPRIVRGRPKKKPNRDLLASLESTPKVVYKIKGYRGCKSLGARAAMVRIECELVEGRTPEWRDIKEVLNPKLGRLNGRKPLLLKILKSTFNVKGLQPVPKKSGEKFIQNFNVKELGEFIECIYIDNGII